MEASEASEVAQCRFCLEDAPVHELLAPCACQGSGRFVHEACLRRWQEEVVGFEDDERATTCQACRQKFSLSPPPVPPHRTRVVPSEAVARQSLILRAAARRSHSRGEAWPQNEPQAPIFDQISTNPHFDRQAAGALSTSLSRRVYAAMVPGCLVLRCSAEMSATAARPTIRAEHWNQGVYFIGGVWPGKGHANSDALIGVNLGGMVVLRPDAPRAPSSPEVTPAPPPASASQRTVREFGAALEELEEHLSSRVLRREAPDGSTYRIGVLSGGPVQPRRLLVLLALEGAMPAAESMPRLVRLVTMQSELLESGPELDAATPLSRVSTAASTPAAANSSPAVECEAVGPPASETTPGSTPSRPRNLCSCALFGEPAHILSALKEKPELQPLGAVAFQGHAVWSNTQLASEVARGGWGLSRARSADVLACESLEARGALWQELWRGDRGGPIHATAPTHFVPVGAAGCNGCTVS
eukprot:TRINITY_DN24025_c0_g1_i3.p1 TRINITY_DN24025_c0_g1~~TRINITY_DN24025_c0_g1_i3.p1  ORF type:complete len:472 (+),score=76.97 TRINITY_DN24025_c0_g1_i3:62-1477(+)